MDSKVAGKGNARTPDPEIVYVRVPALRVSYHTDRSGVVQSYQATNLEEPVYYRWCQTGSSKLLVATWQTPDGRINYAWCELCQGPASQGKCEDHHRDSSWRTRRTLDLATPSPPRTIGGRVLTPNPRNNRTRCAGCNNLIEQERFEKHRQLSCSAMILGLHGSSEKSSSKNSRSEMPDPQTLGKTPSHRMRLGLDEGLRRG